MNASFPPSTASLKPNISINFIPMDEAIVFLKGQEIFDYVSAAEEI
jgi:hypothetical protein